MRPSAKQLNKADMVRICSTVDPTRVHNEVQNTQQQNKGLTSKKALTSGAMALLTGPHQISFSEDSSLTIRLSEGERPVFAPE